MSARPQGRTSMSCWRKAIRRDKRFQKAEGEIKHKEDLKKVINEQAPMNEEIQESSHEPAKMKDRKQKVNQRSELGRREVLQRHQVADRW